MCLASDAVPAIATSYSAPRPVNRPVHRQAERMFFAAMAIMLCASVVTLWGGFTAFLARHVAPYV